jgi:hypothetical protein
METFVKIYLPCAKIIANCITVNLNVFMFKFKNTKFFTPIIIIFIITNVLICRFLIYGDFAEVENNNLISFIFLKNTISYYIVIFPLSPI